MPFTRDQLQCFFFVLTAFAPPGTWLLVPFSLHCWHMGLTTKCISRPWFFGLRICWPHCHPFWKKKKLIWALLCYLQLYFWNWLHNIKYNKIESNANLLRQTKSCHSHKTFLDNMSSLNIHDIRNGSFHICPEEWRAHYYLFLRVINKYHTCGMPSVE